MQYRISDREYSSIHQWLKRKFGKASKCSFKRCKGRSKNYHWALRKNKEYDYKKSNFFQLCVSCHAKYDETPEKLEKMRNNPNSKKTHCPHGHEYTKENVILTNGKYRNCRICNGRGRDRWKMKNKDKVSAYNKAYKLRQKLLSAPSER
jgi:hypothetical protein